MENLIFKSFKGIDINSIESFQWGGIIQSPGKLIYSKDKFEIRFMGKIKGKLYFKIQDSSVNHPSHHTTDLKWVLDRIILGRPVKNHG